MIVSIVISVKYTKGEAMRYKKLGRTGLDVSIVSLGSGGPSQLGQKSGVPEKNAIRLVHKALDLGINLIDTSSGYGNSEVILGKALKGIPRDKYILATKFSSLVSGNIQTPQGVVKSVERSLLRLGIDYIDILQFHGLQPEYYRETVDSLMPTLQKLKEQGKYRFLGASEMFYDDPMHKMFSMALVEGIFDTAMIGYNILNQSAEHGTFPLCSKKNVGVLNMVPVRRSLSRQARLEETVRTLKEVGFIPQDVLSDIDPFGWLVQDSVTSVTNAAYKFVAAHPSVTTVLTGTANIEHLTENVNAILGPPLPEEDMQRLRKLFGSINWAAKELREWNLVERSGSRTN